jgi:PPOX class probable F420-dependent enzyme
LRAHSVSCSPVVPGIAFGSPIPTSIYGSFVSLYPRRVPIDELPTWARLQLESARVARLAFLDDEDSPRVLPVTFALADGAVWSAIDRKPKRTGEPARVRWLRRDPRAALCVDVYDDDWSKLAWVQLLGRVEVLDLDAGGPGLEALVNKYAPYYDEPPPGPLLRLELERALSWRASG